jgi:hypothetical protein
MDNSDELRDLEQARRYLVQGLWLQRVQPATATTVRPVLQWALELATNGYPLPPVGFVADVGHATFGQEQVHSPTHDTAGVPGFPAGLNRSYEDYVLGKLYTDWTFERAGDALRRYQGRDRARGLAFLLNQFRQRAGFPGVHLSPALLKRLLHDPAEQVLAEGWETMTRDGLLPLLPELYEALIAATRRIAEVLGSEDIFELEHGTALADLGQRVALRQVLHMAECLEAALPRRPVGPRSGRREVPTRVLDEDTYPVGGFSSLSTRGSIESLLYSQLAFMEKEERPDLFDIKFLRDELLYYARDENQFLRRRRSFVFVFFPDLVQARFKDIELPCQRIVLLLALAVIAIRKLSEWLSTDALLFDLVFVEEKAPGPLAAERGLLATLLREPIANGTVELADVPTAEDAGRRCAGRARRSLCQCLTMAAADHDVQAEATVVTRLRLDSSCPVVYSGGALLPIADGEGLVECWARVLQDLFQIWV